MAYKIPLFDLNFDKEEENAIIDTLRSKWISIGPKCEEFENKFAEALVIKYSLATANCTVALHLAVKLIGIEPDDEVIVPSLTFAATVNCVTYAGGIPVFADIKGLNDLTISPEDIRDKITSKTRAIIVMHYGGFACDMDSIMKIAKEFNLYVIEDACHAPLSQYKGKKLGTIGDIGCFSFFSNKNMSTGEGGMLVTNNENYYKRAKLLRSHGMTSMSYQRATGHATKYDVVEIGYNYRIDDIRASIGLAQLKKLPEDLNKRAVIRKRYLEGLKSLKKIILPFENNTEFVSNYIMPIILVDSDEEKREQVRDKLHLAGIQSSMHYPAAHLYSSYEKKLDELPVTEYVSNCEITLPMFSKLTLDQTDYIISELKNILK